MGAFMAKRIFDLIFSALGLTILSPIILVISILVKFDSHGSVFFKQIRIGLYGKEFKIYKFRTMVIDAESQGIKLTVGQDSRVTQLGKFLRKYKLDEIPQLINVLKGEMSFVGPRPVVPDFVMLYDDDQLQILNVRPGITDYASINFKNESELLAMSDEPERFYIEHIMPLKIELSKQYIDNNNLWLDIKLIFATVFAIINKDKHTKVKGVNMVTEKQIRKKLKYEMKKVNAMDS